MSQTDPLIARAEVDPSRHLFEEALGRAPGRGRLKGRRVVVFGAGQQVDGPDMPVGNGRAMATLFAREGAHVACVDRDIGRAQRTVDTIGADGRAFAVEGDIAEEESVRKALRDAAAAMGGIDGLVLNVGINHKKPLTETTIEDWDRVFAVNVRGQMLACREAWPLLADGSSIVHVSSMAGLRASGNNVAYDAAKAALAGLCRHLVELGEPRGIRANVLALGWIDTPMGRAATALNSKRATRRMPFRRQATAWEGAYAALFMLSGEASFYNGQTMVLDAGHSVALWD
jgi:NAD(P)-dependent dehydrogenase (short-subunit alcohol dehydrogenase family)